MLIAQAIFLLEHGQTDATERPTHASGYAGVGNESIYRSYWLQSGHTWIMKEKIELELQWLSVDIFHYLYMHSTGGKIW